jgi:hypothetical protein
MLVTNDGQNGILVDHLELGGFVFFAQWRSGIFLWIFTAYQCRLFAFSSIHIYSSRPPFIGIQTNYLGHP